MKLVRLKTVDSTQDELRRRAAAGAQDGTVVTAEVQTGGRGRLGRKWRSPKGGVYASWLLRPRFGPGRLRELSPACGEALAEALRRFGAATAVKPPNDVLARCADGKARKLCGILIEASGGAGRLDWVIVGFGVNVNNEPPLKRATSLRELTGRRASVPSVLKSCLARLSRARRAGDFL